MNEGDDSIRWVVPLAEIDSKDVVKYGGKGVNLARLHEMGFPVPLGFSVTTSCFQRMLTDIPQLSELVMNIERCDDYEEMLELAVGLQVLVNRYSIPRDIETQIIEEFHNLQTRTRKLEHGCAVRSSATIEDRTDISFAGQAESFLCIVEPSDVIKAIKDVWISGFSPSAVIYLNTKDIPLSQMMMSVFVQEMISADVSGVTFTANVVNNDIDEMLINSTWGLGNTLVSGKVIPDTFILSKNPLKVTAKSIGTKERFSRPEVVDGYVQSVMKDTPIEKRSEFTLTNNALMQVAEIGLEIERKMGGPQDIEWCMTGNEIIILQSRPITTLR